MTELWPMGSLPVSRKYLARIQSRGTRGDVVKSLAELVKNSDDTYYLMESAGQAPAGRIWLGYWKGGERKHASVEGFFVKDEGMGMDEKGLRKWRELGESERSINSAIGEGGKDALLGYENCHLFTVSNRQPLVVTAQTDSQVGDIQTAGLAGDICKEYFDRFNARTEKSGVPPLSIERNGTTVEFGLPREKQIPFSRFDKFVIRLSKYYTLRKILSRKNREVILIDTKTGDSIILRYVPPQGILLHSEDFPIQHKGLNFQVKIAIYRADQDLPKEVDVGENILFVSDPVLGPVLDNTMLGFESRPGARRLFGEVVIPDWWELNKMEKEGVITDSREGLDWNNEFNKKLKLRLYSILAKLVEQEERRTQATEKLDESFHRAFKEAFDLINKEIKRESESEPGSVGGEIKDLPPEWLEFRPRETDVVLGTERQVRLRFNPERIPESSIIELHADNECVQIEPYPKLSTPEHYSEGVPECTLVLKAKEMGPITTIIASFGDVKATLQATVVEETEIVAPTGILLRPRVVSYHPGGIGKLRLYVETNRFPQGSRVNIESTNPAITFGASRVTVGQANMTANIWEERLTVRGGKEGDRADVRAWIEESDSEAWASVRVVRPDTPEGYFNDVQLENKTPVGRYHFDKYEDGEFTGKGVVWVHTANPVLAEHFGPGLTNLNEVKRIEARMLLAETVVQCVREIWARYKLVKGIEPSKDPSSFDEIKRISDKVDAEWGPIIYTKMLGLTTVHKRVRRRTVAKIAEDTEGMQRMLRKGHKIEEVAEKYKTTPYHIWTAVREHDTK